MRLLSLAVVAALCAAGFGYAQERKPADPVTKDQKTTKHDGKVTKIDGKKISIKGSAADAKEMTFTTDDNTKFYRADAGDKKDLDRKDKEVAKADDKTGADKKGTPIKLSDVKEGDMVTVMAGADMVATEVWVHAAKKDGTDK